MEPKDQIPTQDVIDPVHLQALEGIKTSVGGGEKASIKYGYDNRKDSFYVEMPEPKKDDSGLEFNRRKREIEKVLDGLRLELFGVVSSGSNGIVIYRIDRKFVDGKINWRRWLINWSNFSVEQLAMIDEVAGFEEVSDLVEQSKGDSYSKFYAMIRVAHRRGLINDSEKKSIEERMHDVS